MTGAPLAWGVRVPPAFRARVRTIAARTGMANPSHLMAAIAFETGCTFSASVKNPNSSGTGLIQFMRDTAIGLGTTVEDLAQMTELEQLDYVERYFEPYSGRMRTLSDVYMAILRPAAIGLPEDAVIFPPGSKNYLANKGLDINHDGAVTKGEAAAFVARQLVEGMKPENATLPDRERPTATGNAPVPRPATPTSKIYNPDQEDPPMQPGTLETIGAIAGTINPLAGLGLGLVGKLVEAFSPVLQGKIAKEVNRHTDDPAIGQKVAADLGQALLAQTRMLTGKSDDFDAVAAVRADPAMLAKVEASADAELDRLTRAADKSITYDKAKWDAQIAGRESAARVAQNEKWDMTPVLVKLAGIGVAVCSGLLLVAIVYQSILAPKGIDPVLLGLAGPLLAITFAAWKSIFDYRFDGTKESSDQTKAILNAQRAAP